MIIYKITSTATDKVYVGLTSVSLQERWTNHKSNCRNPAKYTSALYCAMRKYGVETFSITVVDTATSLEELNIKEQTWIKALNTLSPNGYNLDNGGGSQNCHPETRAKISAALKGRPIKNRQNGAAKGRSVSAERRKQISKTMTGAPQPFLMIARRMEDILQQLVGHYMSRDSGFRDWLSVDMLRADLAVRREFYELELDEAGRHV